MLRLFVLILMFVIQVHGFTECIAKADEKNAVKFDFDRCSGTAEIALKWNKNLALWMGSLPDTLELITFKLIINNQCTLNFRGEQGTKQPAQWTDENGTVTHCPSMLRCLLEINKDGKLIINGNQTVNCGNKKLSNTIGSQEKWTKIRVENLKWLNAFNVVVMDPKGDEIKDRVLLYNSLGSSVRPLGLLFVVFYIFLL
ncbi:hypothetical protein M3Y94_00012000 [Aphelenchoides besseyi]|nr:hypothetical protein M3Y94_00012000 [Aphelenchoides besseyi]KAI6216820.1 hypothetical protein M3Y95_01254700 [Aphelenchoides besseyi]